jgi:hypothetical protein
MLRVRLRRRLAAAGWWTARAKATATAGWPTSTARAKARRSSLRSAPRREVAIVVARAAAGRCIAIVEVARRAVLIGWPILVRSAVLECPAVLRGATVLRGAAVRRWPARSIVELTRAALFERSLFELWRPAAARPAGRAPGPTAGSGVARVLGRFLVPTQEQANGVGDDRSQTLIVELPIGVCTCLSHVGSNLAPQLGLDGGRGSRCGAVRPGCFGHGPLALSGIQRSAGALRPIRRHSRSIQCRRPFRSPPTYPQLLFRNQPGPRRPG